MSDLIRGNQLLRSGQLEEAIAAYQSAVASHPSFYWCHYKLGEALEQLECWQDAIIAYQKAVELKPEKTLLQLHLNRAIKKQNQSSKNEISSSSLRKNKTIQIRPTSQSDASRIHDRDCFFLNQYIKQIYIYYPRSNQHTESVIGVKSNIITSACFAPTSVNVNKFNQSRYIPYSIYFAKLPWALIFFPSSLVISQFRNYWKDSLYMVQLNQIHQILKQDEEKLLLKNNLSFRVIESPTILLTLNGYHNYYHWHINVLPGALELKDQINSGKFKVISHPLKEWQKVSLQMLGIDVSVIEEVDRETILCRFMIYSYSLSSIAYRPPKTIKSVFETIKNNIFTHKNEGFEVSSNFIFISREDSPNRRKLLNETEVYHSLKSKGFVKVIPGDLPYEKQVQCFSSAKIIVAQHGAGLTNIGFAPSGCKVIEILSENYLNECYWRLTQALEHQYAYIIAEVSKEKQKQSLDPRYRHKVAFSAPVNPIVHAVNRSFC